MTREAVSVIGFTRTALALPWKSTLNLTVSEWRLNRKIVFEERIKIPDHLRPLVIDTLIRNILIHCGETKDDSLAAFKIVIERLITDDKGRIYGCDISTYKYTGRFNRDREYIFPGHYVHFRQTISLIR